MPDSSLRVADITAADWQLRIGELGAAVTGLDDVDQCVRVIVSTPRGSVTHRPDFGTEIWRYLDWPVDAARPHVIRETVDAIARWEPRIEVSRVEVEAALDSPGRLLVTITRHLRAAGATQSAPLTVTL